MTSIKLTVTGAHAWASVTGPLTSGMVGIPVTIEYDEAWDGLTKNLMCRCSPWGSDNGESRAILNVGETAAVAHEVMQADMHLYLGIEGFSGDGQLVMPTIWAGCGKIEYGANTCDDPSADPELPVWNQLQAEMEQLKEYALTQDEIQACAQEAAQAAQEARQAADEAKQAASVGGSGLYYTPVVTQPTGDTLKFEFKPSVTGAPIPNPLTVELPVSEGSDENMSIYIGPDEPAGDNLPRYWLDTSGEGVLDMPDSPDVPAEPDASGINAFILDVPYLGSAKTVLGVDISSRGNPAIVVAGNPAANLPLTEYLNSAYAELYAISYRPNAGDAYGGPTGWRAYRYGDIGDGIPVWQEETMIAEITVSATSGVDANKLKIHKLVRADILAALDGTEYSETDIRAITQYVPNVGSKNYNVSVVWMADMPTEEQQRAIIAHFEGGGV